MMLAVACLCFSGIGCQGLHFPPNQPAVQHMSVCIWLFFCSSLLLTLQTPLSGGLLLFDASFLRHSNLLALLLALFFWRETSFLRQHL